MKVQRCTRGPPRKTEQQPLCEIQRESNHQAGKPTKPHSAYQQFFREEKQKIRESGTASSLAKREIIKQIGLKWRSLDPATRSWYDINARDQARQYEIELAHWEMTSEEKQKKKRSPPKAILPPVATAVVDPSPTTALISSVQEQNISSPRQEEDFPGFVSTCYCPSSPSQHLISSTSTVVSCDDFHKMWHNVESNTICPTVTPDKDKKENDAKLQERINLSLLQTQSFSDNDFVDFMTNIQFS